jgi:hypothetical protein
MPRLVDKLIDHDDMLLSDAEDEQEDVSGARREADFDLWLMDREDREVDYFLKH